MKRGSTNAGLESSVTSDAIRGHYDEFAWIYRVCWGHHIHHGLFVDGDGDRHNAQERLLRHCAERAGVRRGMRVADVGCGHGGTTRFLAKEYECSVLGLTISEKQLKIARRLSHALRDSGQVEFQLGNAEHYRFREAEFDLVWNMESSEHFFDKAAYFRKVAATLKPGGTLLVAAWTGAMDDALIKSIAEVFLCPQLLTAEQYREQMEAAGIRVVSSENRAREVAHTWDICARYARAARPVLPLLPARFRAFSEGVELMREGFRSGRLTYSVVVGKKALSN
jgi:tocopherol O-methyltransferase